MSSITNIFGKKEILVAIMLVTAFITFITYIVSTPALDNAAVTITSWSSIISIFSIGLGVIMTLRFHALKAIKQDEGWIWSAWLVSCAVIFYSIGLIYSTNSSIYSWIFQNVLSSLSTTTASLVGLFAMSAAYRAFRVRGFDATVLLASAIIIMIGRNLPLGELISPHLPTFANWIMDYVNTGANRGIRFVMAIVAMGYSIRILLARERGA